MAQFTKVLASEFNTVRNTVANVLGTGSGTRGYGSPLASSTVAVGQKIRPTEFASLTTDINACYRHITNANATTLASIVTGNKISWANFVTYQQAATFVDNNRDTNGGAVSNPGGFIADLPAGWGNASGNRVATRTGTFTWANAEAMRYFWNQGGNLRLQGSSTAAVAPPKNAAFATMANAVNLPLTVANYRNGTGASQAQTTGTAPYSGGTPSGITVSFSAPSGSTTNFTITCTDKGLDGNVASNVGIIITFTLSAQNVSNTTGITQYIPVVTFSAGWVYAP